MPQRAIKRQLTCPIEFTSGSSLIGGNGILVIPRNHLEKKFQNRAECDIPCQTLSLNLNSNVLEIVNKNWIDTFSGGLKQLFKRKSAFQLKQNNSN